MKSNTSSKEITTKAGEHVLPVMKDLVKRLSGLESAVLCTSDGLNICALNLDNSVVGKVSSLGSSVFSIGKSIIETVLSDDNYQQIIKENKELLITVGNMHIMVIEVTYEKLGNLILLVSVKDTAPGVIIVTLQYIAHQLQEALKNFQLD